MAVPVVMTLFTDDAVEVRYSDQSCLQLSPCGSTFVHHESPGQLIHPAHGMKSISQQCQFVTSDYRNKVLQALDFRNRFAERPFACQSLTEEDQIMPLYAKISSAAWPKCLEQANFEYMHDGGVRLISEDEYSSIILSPHRQDFTVCYLCGISSDFVRKKIGSKQKIKDKQTNKCENKGKVYRNKPDDLTQREKIKTSECLAESPKRVDNFKDELNISPISLASTQISRESSPVNDSKTEYNRYSTPTNETQNQNNKQQTKTKQLDCDSLDGSFLQYTQKSTTEKKLDENTNLDSKGANLSGESKHSNDSDSYVRQKHVHWLSSDSGGTETDVDSQSRSQFFYTWITRYLSCEECPASWNHVLNMARAALDNKEKLEKYSSSTSVHIDQKPRGFPKKINPENFLMTPMPEPLSLTCPGQHLHKQYGKYVHDDSRDMVENITALSRGKIKIVLIDGIVFRIVRLSATKFVEIYPGDGSVILSQGLGGHFYRHIIPHGFQVEERTYSLKALPPTLPSSAYSIEKLIKRGSRFLHQTNQEDKTLTNSTVCCWKYKDDTLIEPLAASLIEECTVPGHGRFSAFSNGHIRILFEDRTSLDMSCDFSKRIMGCMEHSKDAKEKTVLQQQLEQQQSYLECKSKQGLCKLLLPNGQYQIVDSKHPGIYRKYTDAAIEWGEWVNSSPDQRRLFYQNWNKEDDSTLMVAKELQKIKCFNYLADVGGNSFVPVLETDDDTTECTQTYNKQVNVQQSRNFPVERGASSDPHSQKSAYNSQNNVPDVLSYGHSSNPSKEIEMMRGFNSVREALLRTSSAIKDIDEIIEKKGFKS